LEYDGYLDENNGKAVNDFVGIAPLFLVIMQVFEARVLVMLDLRKGGRGYSLLEYSTGEFQLLRLLT